MAELVVGAPIASHDGDEWTDSSCSHHVDFNAASKATGSCDSCESDPKDVHNLEAFSELGLSGSLEDLVNTFDKKLCECFGNYSENVETYAPSQARTHEELLDDCGTWWTLTGNYGTALPIDWSKCYTRDLHTKALHLSENQMHHLKCGAMRADPVNLDVSDDEELTQAFDVHAIVTSKVCAAEEDVQTADQVINEIDTMLRMQESVQTATTDDGYMTGCDLISSACSDNLHFREGNSVLQIIDSDAMTAHPGLKQLSCLQLNELLDCVQSAIEEQSAALVRELAVRDDLENELDVKNRFITLCHAAARHQKETAADLSPVSAENKRKGAAASLAHAAAAVYVIPYTMERGPPDSELLTVYIKILKAICENSPAVPTLLTDYILKVVCPT